MKRTITILVLMCLVVVSLCSCTRPIHTLSNAIGDFKNPSIFTLVSTQTEFDLDSDIKITVAYGWVGESDDTLLTDEQIRMDFYAVNYSIGECYLIIENVKYYSKSIYDYFSEKYRIIKKLGEYDFSYSEELVLPKDLFINNSGEITLFIEDAGRVLNYNAYLDLKYTIDNGVLTIKENKNSRLLLNKAVASDPQTTVTTFYNPIYFDDYLASSDWDNYFTGATSEEIKQATPAIIKSKSELKNYYDKSGFYIGGNGDAYSFLGQIYNDYSDDFFEHELLLIIPMESTITRMNPYHSFILLNDNKLFVIVAPDKYNDTETKEPVLHFISIPLQLLPKNYEFEYAGIFEEDEWRTRNDA